jgi:hypothetical protein
MRKITTKSIVAFIVSSYSCYCAETLYVSDPSKTQSGKSAAPKSDLISHAKSGLGNQVPLADAANATESRTKNEAQYETNLPILGYGLISGFVNQAPAAGATNAVKLFTRKETKDSGCDPDFECRFRWAVKTQWIKNGTCFSLYVKGEDGRLNEAYAASANIGLSPVSDNEQEFKNDTLLLLVSALSSLYKGHPQCSKWLRKEGIATPWLTFEREGKSFDCRLAIVLPEAYRTERKANLLFQIFRQIAASARRQGNIQYRYDAGFEQLHELAFNARQARAEEEYNIVENVCWPNYGNKAMLACGIALVIALYIYVFTYGMEFTDMR